MKRGSRPKPCPVRPKDGDHIVYMYRRPEALQRRGTAHSMPKGKVSCLAALVFVAVWAALLAVVTHIDGSPAIDGWVKEGK